MTRAMILAAGLGTRLSPLTDELPKPLLPVGDRPLVAHLAARLHRAGFSSFTMNIHHLSKEFAGVVQWLEATAHVIHEPEIRGTAGGVAGARAFFGEAPILVWNGDVLVEPPIPGLFAAAGAGGLALAVSPTPVGTGTVGLDADGCVVRLRGERFGRETSGGDYVGVAALGGAVLARLPERGCLIGDVALPLLREGEKIGTASVVGRWIDVGSVPSYHLANREWLEVHVGGGGSWVAPTARVAPGARVVASIVGAGASITGDGALERCVVWPGAHAVAPLADAVVTRAGRVVVASS
jgi:mannose-1-phosphate guanylyltransferase